MNLKTVTIADLTPHPDNPNTHPAKQITSLAQSLETFEQVKNVNDIKFTPEQAGEITSGAFDYSPMNQKSTTNTPFTGGYKHLGYHKGLVLPSNIIECAAEGQGIHQAPFPIKLPTFFIKAYSDPLDTWLDPFAGSGTTALAAENVGRLGLMIEQLPKYCAVTLERFHQATQIEPELTK